MKNIADQDAQNALKNHQKSIVNKPLTAKGLRVRGKSAERTRILLSVYTCMTVMKQQEFYNSWSEQRN